MTLTPAGSPAGHAANQAHWDLAMHCAGFGIWDLDARAQVVTFSPTWKRLLGYPEEAGAESTAVWRGRVHTEDLQPMLDALQACCDSPAAGDSYEHPFRVRAADGHYRFVLSRGRIVSRDGDGRALRMLGTMTDLSDRRQAEVLRLERDREQARGRARTEFLARMSHELRTPLNAILGFTQLLQQTVGTADANHQRNQLAQIEGSGWALLALIDQTLAAARAQAEATTGTMSPARAGDDAVMTTASAAEPAANLRRLAT